MDAIRAAPIWLLSLAALPQLVALMRGPKPGTCARPARPPATVDCSELPASLPVASVLDGALGVAARIASLRRTAPRDSPRVSALLAAEVPIVSVEIALTALFSFTLVGPLGVPGWAPAIAVADVGEA
jgi:hypothetical protein